MRMLFLGIVLMLTAMRPAWTQGAGTSVVNEPPMTKGAAPSNTQSMRGEQEIFRRELTDLERKIKNAEDKIGRGHAASQTWKQMSERVARIASAHIEQSAACETARTNLNRRTAAGAPDSFLADARAHVRDCEDASGRYRSALKNMQVEVSRITSKIKDVEENVNDLAQQNVEQLLRKKTLQQLMDTTVGDMERAVRRFENFRGM